MSARQLQQDTDVRDDPGRLLAAALSGNAVFSAGCGLTLLAGAPALSGPFGIPAWLLAGMGMGLVVFAGFLLWVLANPPRLVVGGRALAADVAWVAGGVVLLVGFPSLLTTTGNTALAVVTVVVAVLAAGQAHGLRHIRGRATGTSRTTVRAQRMIAAPPEGVWAAVADIADYARFTSTIAATELVAGAGEGMVRACTDERGGRWTETCTLWDEGRRYRMTVNVGTYPIYYRVLLHELTQTWSLAPTARGTLVSLTVDARLKLGLIGAVVGKILARQLRLEDILAAYERELLQSPSESVAQARTAGGACHSKPSAGAARERSRDQ